MLRSDLMVACGTTCREATNLFWPKHSSTKVRSPYLSLGTMVVVRHGACRRSTDLRDKASKSAAIHRCCKLLTRGVPASVANHILYPIADFMAALALPRVKNFCPFQ